MRSTTYCWTARRSPSLLPKWCTISPWVEPAAWATSRIVVLVSPLAPYSSSAALRMRAFAVRSSSADHAYSVLIVGTVACGQCIDHLYSRSYSWTTASSGGSEVQAERGREPRGRHNLDASSRTAQP